MGTWRALANQTDPQEFAQYVRWVIDESPEWTVTHADADDAVVTEGIGRIFELAKAESADAVRSIGGPLAIAVIDRGGFQVAAEVPGLMPVPRQVD